MPGLAAAYPTYPPAAYGPDLSSNPLSQYGDANFDFHSGGGGGGDDGEDSTAGIDGDNDDEDEAMMNDEDAFNDDN